jgi:DNA-binding FrmR family transcriptional regulator
MEHLSQEDAARLINRLRRVEGQSRGLQRMIEEGRSCDEVFTQLAATKAALDRVGVLLISLKMRECMADDARLASATQEAVEKALDAFLKYSRCVR